MESFAKLIIIINILIFSSVSMAANTVSATVSEPLAATAPATAAPTTSTSTPTTAAQNATTSNEADTKTMDKAEINKTYGNAILANDVLFKPDEIPINPVELIIVKRPECRIFGLLTKEDSNIQGVAKRLVCRITNNFAIWNVEGKIQGAENGPITFKNREEGALIEAKTPVLISIDEVGEMRKGFYVYLYDPAIAFPIIKIQLGQLMSYQSQGASGEKLPDVESGAAGTSQIDIKLPELEP